MSSPFLFLFSLSSSALDTRSSRLVSCQYTHLDRYIEQVESEAAWSNKIRNLVMENHMLDNLEHNLNGQIQYSGFTLLGVWRSSCWLTASPHYELPNVSNSTHEALVAGCALVVVLRHTKYVLNLG